MKDILVSGKKFFLFKDVLKLFHLSKKEAFYLIEEGKIEVEQVNGQLFISEDCLKNIASHKAFPSQSSKKSKPSDTPFIEKIFITISWSFVGLCFLVGASPFIKNFYYNLAYSVSSTSVVTRDILQKGDDSIVSAIQNTARFYNPLFSDTKNAFLLIPATIEMIGKSTQDFIEASITEVYVVVQNVFKEEIGKELEVAQVKHISPALVTEVSKQSFWSGIIDTLSDIFTPLFLDNSILQISNNFENEIEKQNKSDDESQKESADTVSGNVVISEKISVYTPAVYGVSRNELDTALSGLRIELFSLNNTTRTYLDTMRINQASKQGEKTGNSIRNAVENISGSTIVNSSADLTDLSVDTDTLVIDTENNRVGISTSSPFATLSVDGALALTGGFYDNNSSQGVDGYVLQSTGSGIAWVATSSLGILSGGSGSGTVNSGVAGYFTYYDSSGTTVDDQNVLNILGSNIGIGTTSPYAKLSVVGQVVGEYFTATSTTATSTFMGAVGIGTSNPTKTLSVSGDMSISGTLSLDLNTLRATADQLFFGNDAGASATNSQGSNFFGNNSGSNATEASYSNFFGEEAGYQATNAFSSNFLGLSSGWQATNASYSQFIGESSGYQATNASQSIFLGPYAGYQATNAKNSIFIGYGAGTSDSVNNTVSGTSILIGNNASTGGFSNSIGIGKGVVNSAANQFNIGNVLFGTGIYSGDTPSALPTASGNIGIGTTSPYAKLSVVGQVVGEYFTATSTTATSTFGGGISAASSLYVLQNGNVAIGNTSPEYLLHVRKDHNMSTQVVVQNGVSGTGAFSQFMAVSPSDSFQIGLSSAAYTVPSGAEMFGQNTAWLANSSSGGTNIISSNVAGVLRFATGGNASVNERMRITSSGLVGIGTTAPGNMLTIGQVFSADSLPALGSNGGKLGLFNTDTVGGALKYGLLTGVLSTGNAYMQVQRVDGTATAYNMLLQPNGGNVGIGTTSPYAKLSVVGQVVGEYFTATSTTATNTFAGNLNIDSNTLYVDATNNTIGVGTTRSGAISTTNPTVLIKSSTSGSGSSAFGIWSAGSALRLSYRDDGRLWLGTGTASYNDIFTLNSSSVGVGMQFTTAATGSASNDGFYLQYYDSVGTRYWLGESNPHVFYISGSEVARFSNTGAVMQITGTLAAQYSGAGSSRGGTISLISSAGTPQDWYMAVGGTDNATVNGRSWFLYDNTNSAARFFVDTNGNVGAGLGNNQATARVHVRSTAYPSFRGDYDASNYFTASTTSTGLTMFDAVGTTPAFSFSDNVGIGTTSPYAKLSVVGSVVATDFYATSTTSGFKADNLLGGATNLTVDANGNIIRDPSDERLKENIETIVDPLEKIEALRGVTYYWKDKERFGYDQEIGMIAQEVEQVVPQVVSDGGEYKSLNIKNLVALLIEGVKVLKEKVDYVFSWFNGDKFSVQGEVCVDDVCVSKEEFKALLLDAKDNALTTSNSNNSEDHSSLENTPQVDTTNAPVNESQEGEGNYSTELDVPDNNQTETVSETSPDEESDTATEDAPAEPTLEVEPDPV